MAQEAFRTPFSPTLDENVYGNGGYDNLLIFALKMGHSLPYRARWSERSRETVAHSQCED